ncbi:hypothetical protein DL96DRAFT_1682014 [Flagelloscypha sp. PMI_526]|nr:hypothetical protein DL96DRAFT_1682014 [Flagelloscypha sp. PMI_526]
MWGYSEVRRPLRKFYQWRWCAPSLEAWSPGLTHKKDILGYVTPDWKVSVDTRSPQVITQFRRGVDTSSPTSLPSKTPVYLGASGTGYWQSSSPNLTHPPDDRPKPDEQVVYHLHGGGFTYCSGHPSDTTANIPRSLLQLRTLNIARSFSVEYRLASIKPFDVIHPFPTALIDCLNGYPPSFMTSPREKRTLLWLETQLLLTTISTNLLQDGPKKPHEYGIADFNETMSLASLLLGILSEVVGLYRVRPKMCLAAGGAELLFDKIKTLKEDTEKDMGKELLLTENKDASHD